MRLLNNMPIILSEIFYSFQWEGRNTGKPAIFIRFFGCNLTCKWCDSIYSREGNQKKEYTLDTLKKKIKQYPWKHVIFTWWEPAIFENNIKKIMHMFGSWYTFEIETNWSLPLKLPYSQVNVSYKLPNSYNSPYPLKALQTTYDYKFVIGDEKDLQDMEIVIKTYKLDTSHIRIMPLGTTLKSQKNLKLIQYCLSKWYNFSPRLHIILFGNKKGI